MADLLLSGYLYVVKWVVDGVELGLLYVVCSQDSVGKRERMWSASMMNTQVRRSMAASWKIVNNKPIIVCVAEHSLTDETADQCQHGRYVGVAWHQYLWSGGVCAWRSLSSKLSFGSQCIIIMSCLWGRSACIMSLKATQHVLYTEQNRRITYIYLSTVMYWSSVLQCRYSSLLRLLFHPTCFHVHRNGYVAITFSTHQETSSLYITWRRQRTGHPWQPGSTL
jgi:hypothetical protein